MCPGWGCAKGEVEQEAEDRSENRGSISTPGMHSGQRKKMCLVAFGKSGARTSEKKAATVSVGWKSGIW